MRRLIIISILWLSAMRLFSEGIAQSFFAADERTRDANVGVMVMDLSSGRVIDSYHANNLLPTASTMKVITTSTVLGKFGESYRWPTYIEISGNLSDGVVYGNLYVRGTGDPTISSSKVGDTNRIDAWVAELRRLGIRAIEGDVIADISMWNNFDAINPGWLWEDMGNYYGTAIYPLSYRDNTLQITLSSGQKGSVASVVSTNPVVEGLSFQSDVVCSDITYDNAYVYGAPMQYERYIKGEIPANRGTFRIKGDMPDPALLLVTELRSRLQAVGIAVSGGVSSQSTDYLEYKSRTLLVVSESPSLSDIIKETNIHSNNLYAESLFRSLSDEVETPFTIKGSRDAVRAFWNGRGVSLDRSILIDGCGLAPQNGVAPSTFVSVLAYMYNSPSYNVFVASLPIAGESGTLSSFLRGTPLAGRVCAKSGTIAHLKSYAGYINFPDGRVWAFSVVVNNGDGTNREIQKIIEQYLLKVAC